MPKTKFDYFQTEDDEVTFTLIDENTVKRLQKDGTITLPQKTVDATKDMRWNMKQLNSKLLQGIMNGDPIPKIAQSFTEVIGNNEVSTTRAARTMCTNAENSGRQDSYENLEAQGVVQKKVWIATPDDRTREAHLELDGQEVDIDEPFVDMDGNDLMYPGDPDAAPETVWNCRCSMRTHIVGFKRDDGSVSKVDYGRDTTTHADQMDEEKERREQIANTKAEEEKPKKPEISFTPAQTIEEAEQFASDTFIEKSFYNLTGKTISYKGVDIDVANTINQRLNEIYAQYNIPKLSSLEAYGKGNKKVYQRNPDAPFITTNLGNIGMNTTLMADTSKLAAYAKDGDASFQYVMEHKDMLTGDLLHLAEVYEHAGIALVDDSLEGMITHEVGHHISYIPDVNKALSDIGKNTDWESYAKELSGYANHSFGEYVAESWTSYYNGQTEKVQPELVSIFEGLKK